MLRCNCCGREYAGYHSCSESTSIAPNKKLPRVVYRGYVTERERRLVQLNWDTFASETRAPNDALGNACWAASPDGYNEMMKRLAIQLLKERDNVE